MVNRIGNSLFLFYVIFSAYVILLFYSKQLSLSHFLFFLDKLFPIIIPLHFYVPYQNQNML